MSVPNQWSQPEGYEEYPKAVRYLIRECDKDGEPGEIIERKTGIAFDSPLRAYFHSLDSRDQHIADRVTDFIQRACSYFYADEWERLEGVPEVVISDDDVRERIRRIEQGENRREAMRTDKEYYHLTELPWQQQRALIEQIEAVKARWSFSILGES